MVDKFMLFMVLMIALVIVVVSVSQYQQFSLNSSNSVKLTQIDSLLKNQTADILSQLETHRKVTNITREAVDSNQHYIVDTNKILHQLLNLTTPS
jgi:hypothetical protein